MDVNSNEGSSIVIDQLTEGYQRFYARYYEQSNTYDSLVQNGQSPKTLVIACSDSRVDPAIILDCQPGELFVVRNVANLVPPYTHDPSDHHGTSAALEFAVTGLHVTDIIILGHSYCGGINALMNLDDSHGPSDFIGAWMEIAKSAKKRVLEKFPHKNFPEQAHCCERESIISSLNNLNTFPWIKSRVKEGKLACHGWYFRLETGELSNYDSSIDSFVPLIHERLE